jgi:hypothetical protein
VPAVLVGDASSLLDQLQYGLSRLVELIAGFGGIFRRETNYRIDEIIFVTCVTHRSRLPLIAFP